MAVAAHRSADFQSAVSQNCILLGTRNHGGLGSCQRLPIENRRYSRLKICATTLKSGRSRPSDFGFPSDLGLQGFGFLRRDFCSRGLLPPWLSSIFFTLLLK
jgi:hypothetical protein